MGVHYLNSFAMPRALQVVGDLDVGAFGSGQRTIIVPNDSDDDAVADALDKEGLLLRVAGDCGERPGASASKARVSAYARCLGIVVETAMTKDDINDLIDQHEEDSQ